MRESMSLALRRSFAKEKEEEAGLSSLGLTMRGIEFGSEEIIDERKRYITDEEGSRGKVLNVVDNSFKNHSIIIPSNSFVKSREKIEKA